MKIKPIPKLILILAVVGGAYYGLMHTSVLDTYVKQKATIATSVPDKIDLPSASTMTAPSASTVINTSASTSETIRVNTIPWNGNSGMQYAKAAGLFKARGLNVEISRKDDYADMIANMAAFAKDGNSGVHFTIIMGDGLPPYIAGLNAALKPFGQQAKMVAGIGYSRGEDKCIIADGVDVRGSLINGYLGDGDINICIKYAADNGIPVNADPKTYDPNAMNFLGTNSFVEADEKFIASARNDFKGGSCEDRKNTVTGKTQKVCSTGTATWTPGDSKVFNEMKKLGKSIKVIGSTKEYAWQMPTAVIGNAQWMAKNREVTKAFLAAIFEGGEKVRSDNRALMVAAAEQARVNNEQDASYWASMFKGTSDVGPNGKSISLGGSTTNGLADAAFLFGLNGNDNLYKKVYNVYGGITKQYFPDLLPNGLLPYDQVVDSSYVQDLLSNASNVAEAAKPTYGATTETFAAKSYSIEFDSGKTSFKSGSVGTLNTLLDQAAVTALSVQINGHTDSVGDPESNLQLSKARAEAVKRFLMTNAPSSFPESRVQTRGYGDSQPVADNGSSGGRAQNRRVEIILRK